MDRPKTVPLDTHAAATLQYIRASMDAAVSLSIPGSAGIAMGAVGILAAALAAAPALHPYWFWIWIGAAVLAASLGALRMARESARRSAHKGSLLFGTPLRRFMLCLFPGLFGGVVMTAVLKVAGNEQLLPGTWLVLYGCALIAASAPTTKTLGLFGAVFVGLGLLTYALPPAWQMLALGAGFGGLHLAFGALARRAA
ncbi:MAG: hypothetical protein JSR73_08020 [Proteobacteria bacterium]|nr:hypothetical protein [Pseudomonadota bacterium]